jgi:hypothetical protein
MTHKLIRFAYVCEFLLALVAIFTAWSEIGGQAALDLMHWGWKFGFSFALAACVVGYTATIVQTEKMVGLRAAGWLVLMLVLMIAMGVVTYYYTLEEDNSDSDEQTGTVSVYYPNMPTTGAYL